MLSPDDPAVHAFLRRSLIVQLATLSPKGHPWVTPLWFVVHGGVFYITTGPETRAGMNITAHPAVTLLFIREPARSSDAMLRVRGTASCHYGLPAWSVLLRIAAKYYVSPRGISLELRNANKWRLRQAYYAQIKGGYGHIRVVPAGAELLARP